MPSVGGYERTTNKTASEDQAAVECAHVEEIDKLTWSSLRSGPRHFVVVTRAPLAGIELESHGGIIRCVHAVAQSVRCCC
jgi:hypothetical protein